MPPTGATASGAAAQDGGLSLRAKFLIALAGLSLLPFLFITLHLIVRYGSIIDLAADAIPDTATRTNIVQRAAEVQDIGVLLIAVFLVLIVIGTFFAERFFIGEVRTLLSWILQARARNFQDLTPPPLRSDDELGKLGRAMQESVVYFQTIEAREKQVTQQKSEFISVAAHQMRTPLTGLRWGMETLLSEKTPVAQREEIGGSIYATIERMINLVDDLLDAAKLEEGKFGYRFRKMDVVPILRNLLAHFELIARSKKVKIELQAPELLEAYIDGDRIGTAVTNLISNAVDYTAGGGTVTVALRDRGNRAEISISDTGIGIPPSYLPQLFSKFARAENAIRMRPDGSGLGLYIAHNIVERHGSKLEVVSEPGKGSTFSFTVPKKEADLVPQESTVEDFFAKF